MIIGRGGDQQGSPEATQNGDISRHPSNYSRILRDDCSNEAVEYGKEGFSWHYLVEKREKENGRKNRIFLNGADLKFP